MKKIAKFLTTFLENILDNLAIFCGTLIPLFFTFLASLAFDCLVLYILQHDKIETLFGLQGDLLECWLIVTIPILVLLAIGVITFHQTYFEIKNKAI